MTVLELIPEMIHAVQNSKAERIKLAKEAEQG